MRQKVRGRMARGGHGLPKVLLGSAMPCPLRLAGGSPLKWPHGRFRVCPQGEWPLGVFYPFGHSTPYASEKVKSSGYSLPPRNPKMFQPNTNFGPSKKMDPKAGKIVKTRVKEMFPSSSSAPSEIIQVDSRIGAMILGLENNSSWFSYMNLTFLPAICKHPAGRPLSA
jgi:hypothetical protein